MGAVSTDDGSTPAPRRRRNPASGSSETAKKTTAAKPTAAKKVPSKSTARDTAARATAGKARTRKTTAAAATPATTRRRSSAQGNPRGAEEFRAVPSAPPAVTAAPTAVETLPDDRYFNRELSWQDFNARVLALAEDESQPLLERTKFLAIFASNLDEFYMVRVAGLKRRDETGLPVRSADGLTPREQLARISARTQALAVAHAKVFLDEVCPELDKEGIRIHRWSGLTDEQRATLSAFFRQKIFPVLTPLAVDPAHPFPYISRLSLNLAVT